MGEGGERSYQGRSWDGFGLGYRGRALPCWFANSTFAGKGVGAMGEPWGLHVAWEHNRGRTEHFFSRCGSKREGKGFAVTMRLGGGSEKGAQERKIAEFQLVL